uniref:Target of myb1 like 2 membrane trafficking protein n=1 Tax=Pygocentrus nattereri TaxID=42514 RepID=A0A3B4BW01_PYGNA
MEFLLGNPYSTPVGQCIEKATDGSLQSEDWTLNMEICDIINETEDGPKDAIRAVKKRLNGNKNYREVMLTLTVLETCVKNCGYRFHALVTTRDFIDGVLVKVISPKNNPPAIVQDKVLALIQAWADAFRSSPDLTGVVHVYEEMKRKGIEFPRSDMETLSPIHTPQRNAPEGDHKYNAPVQPKPQPQPGSVPAYSAPLPHTSPQIPNLQMSGPINPTPEQICRLRSELDIVRGNTKVMSEMLTEMVPGQEDPSDHELLQELNRTCRAMQQRIVELISRVSNEEVTEELLHVNDDLNNIFLRYERYERFRSGRTAHGVNNGVLSEATEDNLIDLGPGSPAVVSPRITSPATLSSRLAGLDVGADSVSGTLSSLSSCQPQDDFDMFAQTRTGTLSDQQKNYIILYFVFMFSGFFLFFVFLFLFGSIPWFVHDFCPKDALVQSSVMDDIEEWCCLPLTQLSFASLMCLSLLEFDKFLEERAKAAEMVPALPTPPGGDPAAAVGSAASAGKKAERSEDAMFAL